MSNTTFRVRYTGVEERFSEIAITGKQQVWLRAGSSSVPIADASLLLASGKFVSADRPVYLGAMTAADFAPIAAAMTAGTIAYPPGSTVTVDNVLMTSRLVGAGAAFSVEGGGNVPFTMSGIFAEGGTALITPAAGWSYAGSPKGQWYLTASGGLPVAVSGATGYAYVFQLADVGKIPSFVPAGPISFVITGKVVGSGALPVFAFEAATTTALAAFAVAGPAANSRRQYSINRAFKRLVPSGILTKLQSGGFWVIANGTEAQSLINLANPGVRNLTKVGSPVFTAGAGWNFPTTADYLETGIALSSLARDDISMGYWGRNDGTASTSYDMGASDASSNGLNIKLTSPRAMVAACNGASVNMGGNNSERGGMFSVNRTAAGSVDAYHNSVKSATTANASVAPSLTTTIRIGGIAGLTSNGCTHTLSAAFIGKTLTDAEMQTLYAATQRLLQMIEFGDLDIREAGYAPSGFAADVVVYGATAQGVTFAYEAARQGLNVALVGAYREGQIGGMTSGGLGQLDYDVPAAIGGLARNLIARCNTIQGLSDTNFQVMPRDAEAVFRAMLDPARAGGVNVPVFWSEGVASVSKTGTRITTMTTIDGRTFSAPYFVDATFEGDLAALGGVSMATGREANATYGETINGYRGFLTSGGSSSHQFNSALVDPYVTPTVPGSGLIYGVEAVPSTAVGDADNRTQLFNYRMTMTSGPKVPLTGMAMPSGYSAAKYEIAGRYCALMNPTAMSTFFIFNSLPGNTKDLNAQLGFSSDITNSSIDYVACDMQPTKALVYAARETVIKRIQNETLGLLYYFAMDPDSRIPAALRTDMLFYGFDTYHYLDPVKDDALHFNMQLYVREHRRMVSDIVWTQNDIAATDGTTPRSIKTVAAAAYAMDSHLNRRMPDTTTSPHRIWCEGNVEQQGVGNKIAPIPYDICVPKATECTNVAVLFCVSASHAAFGSIRMELTSMQLGQSMAFAVKQAITNGNQNLQSVDYTTLRASILASGDPVTPVLPQVN